MKKKGLLISLAGLAVLFLAATSIITGTVEDLLLGYPLQNNGYSGFTEYVIAGEALDRGTLVYVTSTTGTAHPVVNKADADASTTLGDILIVVEAAADGDTVKALSNGLYRNDAWTWTTPGSIVYASTSGGAINVSAPTAGGDYIQEIGFTRISTRSGVTSKILRFKPALSSTAAGS